MENDRYRLDYTGAQINKAIKNALNIPNCCKNLSLGIGDDGLVYIFADGVPIGNGIEITGGGSVGITYTITYDLYDVTSSNTDTTVSKGAAFETVLSVAAGDMIPYGNIVVTMSGKDITSTAYNTYTKKITIGSVTGNINVYARATAEAEPTDIMSNFKYLGTTTYSPGTYTAWCPTGLIYDETRDVYAHFMNVQNTHYNTPNVCELWFNTINPYTLEHSEPVFIARTTEMLSGQMKYAGALGCCIKNGSYFMFSTNSKGYYKSTDGGATWSKATYGTGPDKNPWGCYVLSNGRMIMGSDEENHKVYYSDDDGKNWTTVQCENFNEPTFVDFGNGTVMAICRENMDSNKNIQQPWMHVSNDYGATWSESVRMETVGYMGNNNCNAYVHDNYVELFVGSRGFTNSPQYDGTTYEIRQYVLDRNKGPVDEFAYVNTVYKCAPNDNPQGVTGLSNQDDFSTPCIAIKDKSHSLLTFYAPANRFITHHLVAVGNIPVDNFEIPKPMPEQFTASQDFSAANSAPITVCNSYGVTYRDGFPQLNAGKYLDISDIREGGYLHAKTTLTQTMNGWELPILTHVEDLSIYSWTTSGYMPRSPLPVGCATLPTKPYDPAATHAWPTDGTVFDIYARYKNKAWWLFYSGTWLRFYTSDSGVKIAEGCTLTGNDNRVYEPYTIGGLTSYTTFGLTGHTKPNTLRLFEYDKAQ